MELSNNQRLHLQTVFDYFYEHGKWPTYRYVDRKLTQIQRDLDIEEISKSLPLGLVTPFNGDLNADAALFIPAIHACKGSEDDLANFINALMFCVDKHFSAEAEAGTVEISSAMLAQHLGLSELSIRKLGLLLRDARECPIYEAFRSEDTEYKVWNFTLSGNIRYLDGVTSIEKYLEKTDQLRNPSPTIVKSQGDNQHSNEDKRTAFAMMNALLFQNLVYDLLRILGYRVVPEPRVGGTYVDFLAYYPYTSPSGVASEEVWIGEVKYRNLASKEGLNILRELIDLAQYVKASRALLVTNSILTNAAKEYASKRKELEIWDTDKLLAFLKQFPQLRQKYAEVIPQLDSPIKEEELAGKTFDNQHELVRELRNLPTGDGEAYEGLVKRILEFCFSDEFSPFRVQKQVPTEDGKRRRDFIIDNRNPTKKFWQNMQLMRKVEKILFDAKNYKDPVEYREISDTLRYLDNNAFGNFIIIICRRGVKDYKEALDSFSKSDRITLFLSDDDIVKMINLKLEGESPTLLIEDRYYEFLGKK